ncbi:SRPBCC family protein [Flavihumibacter solisilvae]|uniref:SRPBCC family protein n=1 Tax=Flavihumibacter solisilvae TaxID=1349421 RepID=UPI0006901091|nr:SRPBCC domain-containing protein [Flavihumibacter solisilvae]
MHNEIKHEWIFEQSPNEVWEYLTQAELIALWLMPNDFKPIAGHEFQLLAKAMPDLGLDGVFHCKVLEIEPCYKLSYSWKAGSGNGTFTLDTICEWTLEPQGRGTKLLLKHSGFKEANYAIFSGMKDGWLKKIEKMLHHINSNQEKLSL